MKVSVMMITYNHEKYIAKALDSVLMQQTDFDYEIVVGEDCSTDDTRKILLAYDEENPGKFKLLLNETNLGMHENGSRSYRACEGQYVAMLDGDDYWTSPDKLQLQVDFLEKHQECAICFHNVKEIFEDNRSSKDFFTNELKDFYTIEDLLRCNFIPTPSVMFRNNLFGNIPDWFSLMPMGDWPLHILNSMHGSIGYINKNMATHVNHVGSMWYEIGQDWLKAHISNVIVYDILYENIEDKYKETIKKRMHELCLDIANRYENEGNNKKAKKYALMSFMKHYCVTKEFIKICLRLYAFPLYRIAIYLKRSVF